MSRCRTVLVASIAVLAGRPALAQEEQPPQTLRWRFEAGASDRYQQVSTLRFVQKGGGRILSSTVTATVKWTQTVRAVDARGIARLRVRYDSLRVRISNPQGTVAELDSTQPGEVERALADPRLKPFASLVGTTQTLKVSPRGRVLSATSDSPVLSQSTAGEWQLLFGPFPQAPIAVKGTWASRHETVRKEMAIRYANRHTLASSLGGQVKVETRSALTPDLSKNPGLRQARVRVTKATARASLLALPAKGRVKSCSVTSKLRLAIELTKQGRTLRLTQELSSREDVTWQGKGPDDKRAGAQGVVVEPPKLDETIAKHIRALGTANPDKRTDPAGWKAARAVRKRAAKALEALGERALPALRVAATARGNKTLRAWAAYVIKRIERARGGGE